MEDQYGSRSLDVMSGVRDNAALPTQGRGTQATFSIKSVALPGVLDENGMPKVSVKEFVTLHIAGDRKSSMIHQLKPAYRDVFLAERGLTEAYRRWKSARVDGSQYVGEGMPLEQWAAVTREQVEVMRYHRIFTVQQLADAHDGAIANLGMGFTELRTVAKKWLESAQTTGASAMMRREVDNLATENAELQKRLEQMAAEMTAMKRLSANPVSDSPAIAGTVAPNEPPHVPPAVNRVRVNRTPEPATKVVDTGVDTPPAGFGADAGADQE